LPHTRLLERSPGRLDVHGTRTPALSRSPGAGLTS